MYDRIDFITRTTIMTIGKGYFEEIKRTRYILKKLIELDIGKLRTKTARRPIILNYFNRILPAIATKIFISCLHLLIYKH